MKKKDFAKCGKLSLVLILLISVLVIAGAIVAFFALRDGDTPDVTEGTTTSETTSTDSSPDFKVTPTADIDVEVKDRTITLYIPEGVSSVNFAEMVTAKEEWTVTDADKNSCENGILTIKKNGDTFTVRYGLGTVYLVQVYYQTYYKVTFEGIDRPVSVKKQSLISVPDEEPEKAGYTFAGWDFDFTTPISAAVTISAKWTPNTYKVIYNANGGSVAINSQEVTFGVSVDLPTPTKEGFTFIGWFDGDLHVSSGPWTLAKNVTLYAVWGTDDYRITYDANGGYVDTTIQGISFGEPFTTPVPKRTGYTFMGWYVDGKPVNTSAYAYTQDMTFVAEWLENRYTVEYETNGGTPITGATVLYSEIGKTIPSRPGYTFGGWFFSDDLSETNVVVGNGGIVKVYAWWSEENKTSDFDFEYTDAGAVITGYHASRSICVVPSFIGGKPVVALGTRAFADCTTLTHIELPSSVTAIGDYAFSGAIKLSKINPIENTEEGRAIDLSGIVSIGAGAFSGCTFETIILPKAITHLSDYLFENCQNLLSVDMTYITSAGSGVFKGCTALSSMVLPSSIPHLGDDFFRGCRNLFDLTLPSALTTLGNGVFADCVLLTEIKLPATLTKIGDSLFEGCTSLVKVDNFVNNSKITSIGARAFANCGKLTGLSIPVGVTSIGEGAFENCLELKTVTLPSAVTVIENNTFYGCSYLTTVTVQGRITKIGDNAFNGCRRLSTISLPTSLEYLGEGAFMNCLNLTVVDLTNTLSHLGTAAFSGCTKLGSITVSSAITEIPDRAFENCSALSKVSWHNGIIAIGARAFYGCTALSLDYMPTSVDVVKTEAFSGCSGIQTLRFEKTLSCIESLAFADCISLTAITFEGSAERWKGAVASDAFEGCDDLKGNISVVTGIVDDLRTSLSSNFSTQALWAIDSTLAMNNQRPAAVIRFRPNSVYYRNLVTVDPENSDPLTSGKINEDYIWKLVLEGRASDGFVFTITVNVSLFEVYNMQDGGYVIMDLGERFASMADLERCTASLEIYGVANPGTLLYIANLGTYVFSEEKETVTEDETREETERITDITLIEGADMGKPYGADHLFDDDIETKFFSHNRTPIIVKLSEAKAIGSYSFVTTSAQIGYPTALPVSWTLYGGVVLKDGSVEWVEISRVENAMLTTDNLVEYNFNVSQGSSFSEYKLEFDGDAPIMLSEIWLYQKV